MEWDADKPFRPAGLLCNEEKNVQIVHTDEQEKAAEGWRNWFEVAKAQSQSSAYTLSSLYLSISNST